MNSFIHLLLFTVVAAVLFASSDPTIAAAPAGEEAPPEPSKGDDDEDIPDKLRIDNNPFGVGLLRGIGSGIKGILSSVAVGLGGEKELPIPSYGDYDEDVPDIPRFDKSNQFGEGLLRDIGSGVKSILSSVSDGLGGTKPSKTYF